MKIKKGDTVKVISGSDKNKVGEVLKVLPKENKVVVKDVNVRKRHTKPRRQGEEGGIVEFEAPINVSNVMLVCPKTGEATRVRYEIVKDEKVRVCKKSGEVIKNKKVR